MRQRWKLLLCAPVVASGCSKILGIDDLTGPGSGSQGMLDAALDGTGDAPGDGSGSGTGHLTIQGVLRANVLGQPAGVATTVELLDPHSVPPKALAKTTSAQSGAFVMTMPYAGTPVDVVVHAQGLVSSQLRDAYLYFPDPLSTDRDIVLELLSEVELKDFSDRAAVPFSATTSLVEVVVTTSAGVPASGATVANQPSVGTIRYGDGTGHPVIQAIATDVDGLAFLFSGQPGDNTMTVTTQGGSRSQVFQIVGGAVIYLPEPLAR